MLRWVRTIVLAAIAGDLAITLYLVLERAISAHLPFQICLLQLMQWDASNAYGSAAFSGGWTMAGIGQLMDIGVSLGWAAACTFLWIRFPVLRRRTWLWGLAFGCVVMVVMLYVLVPLGHAAPMHNSVANVVRVLIAHTIFFGLPLALVVQSSLDLPPSALQAM